MVSAPQKQEGARVLKAKRVPEWRIAALVGISRSGMLYQIHPKPQDHLAKHVKSLSAKSPRYGQARIRALMRRVHIVVNHKAGSRLRQKLGLHSRGSSSGRRCSRARAFDEWLNSQIMYGPMTSSLPGH